MSSPIAASNQFNVSTVNLPITNKSFIEGINVATIPVENSFLNISLNATIGENSSISIVKVGLGPENYTGNINTNLHLGSDIFNKKPFIGKQTVTVLINVAPNETVFINNLTYNFPKKPVNFKTLGIIFLIVFFILNIFIK
jgi:hypothetical protein